ncbi:MAG: YgiQ family radical SAM protein, partial [Spirochaetales bacterium]|nr:YgiQ family radical SAM protein [Spirochaetales bacterium]
EASLRRMGHYDFWSDKIRRSVLLDSKADLLVYGMGETQVREIARRLAAGERAKDIDDIPGTAYRRSSVPEGEPGIDYLLLPEFDEISKEKKSYAESFIIQYKQNDGVRGRRLVEPNGSQYVIQNPPAAPPEQAELDRVYELPYQRLAHPAYKKHGGVPAIQEVQFSLTSSRGCFGDCSFCALAFHQGRRVYSRSHESLESEAKALIDMDDFKGHIHDVGGPTANFRTPSCTKQLTKGLCEDKQCLYPGPCKSLEVDHSDYLGLLRKLRKLPGIKKVFVRSGIRYDYLMHDRNTPFLEELVKHHVSGQLKVAPEHVDPTVLQAMGKPGREVFDRFADSFNMLNKKLGKKQFLVPYFISSHPGSDMKAAVALAEYQRDKKYRIDQVQDFYPTPGTLSTCMYHTGIDPRTMKPVYVPKGGREKNLQRALLQYFKPENYGKVREALKIAGRTDLIGRGGKCLVPYESR